MDFTEAWEDTCSTVGFSVRQDNVVELKNLIKKSYPVDVADNRGWRPLHEAAALTSGVQCLEVLLQCESTNVNWTTHEGETALLLACKRRNRHAKEAVALLLQYDAKPNIYDNDQETPILVATKKGDLSVVNLLISAQADVNIKDCSGWSPLHEAAKSNDKIDILKRLLLSSAELDSMDECGLTPVFVATQHGQIDCLKELLRIAKRKGRLDVVNIGAEDDATPLMIAAQQGFLDCMKVLLNNGADPNLRATDDATALHSAVQGGHPECLRLLLDKMDLVPIINACHPLVFPYLDRCEMLSPVHLAIEWKSYNCLKLLLQANFSADSLKRSVGMPVQRLLGLELSMFDTALSFAVSLKDRLAASILLEAGATPNIPCQDALHPLLESIHFSSPKMFDFLLEKGSDVNYCTHQRCDTNLILVCALVSPHWDRFIPKLLRAGCNPRLCFSNSNSVDLFANSILRVSNSNLFAWRMIWLLYFVAVDAAVQEFYHAIEMKAIAGGKHDATIWKDINEAVGQPSPLKHICRMSVRHKLYACNGSHFRHLIHKLPLPSTIVDYLSFNPMCPDKYSNPPVYHRFSFSSFSDDSEEDMSADFQEGLLNVNLSP